MKKNRRLIILLFTLLALCFADLVSAQSGLETFMQEFEPDYGLDGDYVLNTANPYVKPIRQMVTTESGVVIMLDKVLVTEDQIVATVLLGVEPANADWTPPSNFQLGFAAMEVTPHIPYPSDYFEIIHGGGGGGGPILNNIHDDPFVVYDFVRSELMFDDGYVSPKDSMHVKVKILHYEICWDIELSENYSEPSCFREQGPWEFEFETDGKELAEKTKEFEIGKKFEIEGKSFSLDRLRFNPMHLIAFISGSGVDCRTPGYLDNLHVFIETDDRTAIHLWSHMHPYIGFDRQITDDVIIASLEKTKSLKVMFCLSDINGEFPSDYNPDKIKFYTCDPAWTTVIQLDDSVARE